jgi:hypothetical protein
MTEPGERKEITVAELLADTENPRLPEEAQSQIDAIRTMAKNQGDRIMGLAEHLVRYGPNPADLPIVMRSHEFTGMYTVLDGNRRLTALKLLESPSLADGMLSGRNTRRLKELSEGFSENPVSQLLCVVMSSREQADPWIQLRHRGQREGAGLVEWDGQVAARYDQRKGERSYALQILDFAKEKATLSEETQKLIEQGRFPITTLDRLINTRHVRNRLGIEKSGEHIITSYPSEEAAKGISRIVEDLGSRGWTVSKLKILSQRIKYIDSIPDDELPDPSTELDKAYNLASAPSVGTTASQKRTRKKRRSTESERRVTLIPSDTTFSITQHRVEKIFRELQALNVDEFTNAGAVMLRVFIELSVDHYLETTIGLQSIGWTQRQLEGSKLSTKLKEAADYMEQNNIMTHKELIPVKKAADTQTLLLAAITTLHSYIHNRHASPLSSEIKTTWDDWEPFLGKIWQ